ncbi:hypothetical protein BCV71DRAFT_12749 [Rhizopus microsporus]|uniref:Uncharacterized protein n=1 Tax=Rhizopus microsporus TaxID=58291 RepID=A0A1X0SD44_RHIZD|nr:hypothetical protein BCV71DRAFT_12749 [Rhizopus microsporus]
MATGLLYQNWQEDTKSITRKESVNIIPIFYFVYSLFKVLEQTILAEASLSQLCQSARQQQQQQTIDYQEKALRMATLEARLDPEQVRSIQQQLRNVIQLPDQDDTFALQKEVNTRYICRI